MTTTITKLAADVDRIIAIDRQLDSLTRERKALAQVIEAAALESPYHEPLNEADREGRQVILRGTDCAIPVIFESDLILGSFPEGGEAHLALQTAAGLHADHLQKLWVATNKLERVAKDGQAYRRALREYFPPNTAAAVLAASLQRSKDGIPKSRTVIDTSRILPLD
jgi:hypothetical protein